MTRPSFDEWMRRVDAALVVRHRSPAVVELVDPAGHTSYAAVAPPGSRDVAVRPLSTVLVDRPALDALRVRRTEVLVRGKAQARRTARRSSGGTTRTSTTALLDEAIAQVPESVRATLKKLYGR